jgi:antirestriction protein ArdC
MRRDIYLTITNQIVAELEKGARPWFKPLNTERPAGMSTTL